MLDKLPVSGIARIEEVKVSGTVLAFTGGLALLTGLLFGLIPAVRGHRIGLAGVSEGGRGSAANQRMGSILVATQFALSMILLIGTGLLLKSFQRLQSVNPGFNPAQTITLSAALPRGKYDKPEQSLLFYQNAIERLGSAPGIRAVGFATSLPFAGDGNSDGIIVEGREPAGATNVTHTEQAILQAVTPGFFQALGVPVLQGRDFGDSDSANSQPVAVIDEPLARHYWPNGDALGKRIETTGDLEWMTIIGIVGGVNNNSLAEEKAPHLYMNVAQSPSPRAFLVVRTAGPPAAAFPTINTELKRLEPDLPIYLVRSMTEIVGQTLSTQRLTNLLLMSFAILALLLAAVGIYGTMSLYVGRRRKEFGIRLALGAQPATLLWSVQRHGVLVAAAGGLAGIAGALALTQTITSLLFEVSATDPLVFGGIPALLLLVAQAACYLPASRSARVDPLTVLRYE